MRERERGGGERGEGERKGLIKEYIYKKGIWER